MWFIACPGMISHSQEQEAYRNIETISHSQEETMIQDLSRVNRDPNQHTKIVKGNMEMMELLFCNFHISFLGKQECLNSVYNWLEENYGKENLLELCRLVNSALQ